ncbi:MAG: hypothetical protein MAG715_00845 [Methanonatronarchaeales archaeon]|nr:hypothetical protein [Methanonatronarchaeales archaeon]
MGALPPREVYETKMATEEAELGQRATCGPWAGAWASRMMDLGADELVKRAVDRGKVPVGCLTDEQREALGV